MLKVIIADDNKGVALYLSEMIKRLGHEPIVCANGKEALDKFIEHHPDLLLLDNHMPIMDGLEVCREIRKLPEGVHVPVVMISAYNSETNIQAGLDAGASDYLGKPIVDEQLMAKIKIHLKTHSLYKADFDLMMQHAVLFNRYKIKRFIGYGTHSVVFLAEDNNIEGKMVAVKFLHESATLHEMGDLFIKTADQFLKIESENIIKIFAYGKFSGRLYLVQEFAEGGNLATVLKHHTFSQMKAFKLASDLIKALKVLHAAKIIHLDIKPENIMVSGDSYKLGDFGVNSMIKKTGAMFVNPVWGKMEYSSPEVIENPSSITCKSDIYSLGIILYQSLTGDNPFESDKPAIVMSRQVNFTPQPITGHHHEFSKSFSALIHQMLNKDPEKRPSASEIDEQLSSICEEISTAPEVKVSTDLHKTTAPDKTKIPDNAKTTPVKSKAKSNILDSLIKLIPVRQIASAVIVILALGISVWGGYAVNKLFSSSNNKETITPPGAVSMTMCTKCSNIEERRSQDIKDIACSKCGGHLGYARKCDDCGRVFPFVPLIIGELPKTMSEFGEKNTERQQCPDCNSANSSPVQTTEEEKLAELNPTETEPKAP